MTDRTTPKIIVTRPSSGRDAFPIANAVRLAPGTLVQLSSGYADHWDDAGAGSTFMGVAIAGENSGNAATDDPSTWLGDTSGLPAPDPEVHVDTSGVILMHLASLAGTVTQATVGDLVYSADSDTDSLTQDSSGRTNPIGFIIRWRSATDVDVQLFTPAEFLCIQTESA